MRIFEIDRQVLDRKDRLVKEEDYLLRWISSSTKLAFTCQIGNYFSTIDRPSLFLSLFSAGTKPIGALTTSSLSTPIMVLTSMDTRIVLLEKW